MSLPMRVVDKDTEFFRKEQIWWNKRGVSIIRVETTQEAFGQLNIDTIRFLPHTLMMRSFERVMREEISKRRFFYYTV